MEFFVRTKINNIFRSIKLTTNDLEQNKEKLVEIIIEKGEWKRLKKFYIVKKSSHFKNFEQLWFQMNL